MTAFFQQSALVLLFFHHVRFGAPTTLLIVAVEHPNDEAGESLSSPDGNRLLKKQLDLLDRLLAGLETKVLGNDEVLERLEHTLVSAEETKCRHEVRRAELESRKAELWVKLLEIQSERDAVKQLEAELEHEIVNTVQARKDAAVRYREAERTGAGLERELAEVKARRKELGERLAATEPAPPPAEDEHSGIPDHTERDETNPLALAPVAGPREDQDLDEIEIVEAVPLRLVHEEGSTPRRTAPPPPPAPKAANAPS